MNSYDEKRKSKLLSVSANPFSPRYTARYIAIASLIFLDSHGMLPIPEEKWVKILQRVAKFNDPHGRMIAFTNENRGHHHEITRRYNGYININDDIKPFLISLKWDKISADKKNELKNIMGMDNTSASVNAIQYEMYIERAKNIASSDTHSLNLDILAFVQGDSQAGTRIFTSGRSMTQEELDEVIKIAKYNGSLGERLVADYFESCLEQKIIRSYEWASQKNAISPYDFKFADNAGVNFLLDVKSTSGEFSSSMYISMRELMAMAQSSEQYDIYRVYNLTEKGGCLRIAEGMRDFAQSILNSLANLPEYARVDSFSIDIKKIAARFGKEIELYFDGKDEE